MPSLALLVLVLLVVLMLVMAMVMLGAVLPQAGIEKGTKNRGLLSKVKRSPWPAK